MPPTPTPPSYAPPPRRSPGRPPLAAATPAPGRPCPSPLGEHETFGGVVCAWCGQRATVTRTVTPEEVQDAVEPVVEAAVADAFLQGQEVAYARVLAFLDALPEAEATKGRDHGRGVAHGAREIALAIRALRTDALGD